MSGKISGALLATSLGVSFWGCGQTDPRVAMVRAQVANYQEVHGILSKVTDAESMAKAKTQLQSRRDHFQRMAERAKDLNPEVPPEVADQIRTELPNLEKELNRTLKEMVRIQALPGGVDFINDMKTWYPIN